MINRLKKILQTARNFDIKPAPPCFDPLLKQGRQYYHDNQYYKAQVVFEKLYEAMPDHLEVIQSLISTYIYQLNSSAAEKVLLKAIKLFPEDPHIIHSHAVIFLLKEQIPESINTYQRYLEKVPNDKPALFTLQALKKEQPKNPPIEFISQLFDRYAHCFERHIVDELRYKTPKLIRNIVKRKIPKAILSPILDLGCGTGLLGQELRSLGASMLEGVDISEEMLKKCKEKNIYQQLHHIDIIDFLHENNKLSTYSLIVASDVIPYFGDLHPLFYGISQCLNLSGYFIFSTEMGKKAGFLLQQNGRYQHHLQYIIDTAEEYNLKMISHVNASGRYERYIPVIMQNIMLQKIA